MFKLIWSKFPALIGRWFCGKGNEELLGPELNALFEENLIFRSSKSGSSGLHRGRKPTSVRPGQSRGR